MNRLWTLALSRASLKIPGQNRLQSSVPITSITKNNYPDRDHQSRKEIKLPQATSIENNNENDDVFLYTSRIPELENMYIFNHVHRKIKLPNLSNNLEHLPINQLGPNREDPVALAQIKLAIKGLTKVGIAKLLDDIKAERSPQYRSLKRIIEYELRSSLRLPNHWQMDLNLCFHFADLFFQMDMKSRYTQDLIRQISTGKIDLTRQQILHTLFLIIIEKDHYGFLDKYESRILDIVRTGSLEDIATVCMAYFKTRKKANNLSLLRRIADKTVDHLPNVDPSTPGLCSIFKYLRWSRKSEIRDNVLNLIKCIGLEHSDKVISTGTYNSVHLLKLMEVYRVRDSQLMDLIFHSVFDNLDDYRIKDIQYAITSFSNFAYKDLKINEDLKRRFDSLSEQIVAESRGDYKMQYYHLMPLLRAFVMFGYYNDDLINYVNKTIADPTKFDQMKNVLEFEKSALLAYVATQMEHTGAKLENIDGIYHKLISSIERVGNFGNVNNCSSLSHLDFVLKNTNDKIYVNSNAIRRLSLRMSKHPDMLDSTYNLIFQHTFPHQNYADLVISKGHQEPGQFSPDALIPVQVPAGERHCILLAVRREDYVDGSSVLSGYKQLITRLLTKLGYSVIYTDFINPNIDDIVHKVKNELDSKS